LPEYLWSDGDRDPAIAVAVETIFPLTKHRLCIWHITYIDFPKNLKGILGKRYFEFMHDFWLVRNALTEETFERLWPLLLTKYPDTNTYLGTYYSNRSKWAWPWMALEFSDGVQSTQRVKNQQHIIKACLSSNPALVDVVRCIKDRIERQKTISEYNQFKQSQQIAGIPRGVLGLFDSVVKANSTYLGIFADTELKKEMMASCMYRYKQCDLDEFVKLVCIIILLYFKITIA